ncbi:MAG: hypothetical protein ACOX5N_05990 [Bacilli bacterium]
MQIKTIPSIGTSAYTVIVTNGTVDVEIRVDKYIAEFNDVKALMNSLIAGQYVDWIDIPVGEYNGTPQLMISTVSQADVTALDDDVVAQLIADEIESLYDGKIYPMGGKIELITSIEAFAGTITWATTSPLIDVENGDIGTVEEDAVVQLTATITVGEATLEKIVSVTVKFVETDLLYEFDFESGGGTSYPEEGTYSFNNLVDNSDFEVNVHRISAQTTGAVEGATRALVISPRIGGTNDGTAWAEFDFGETVVKQMEFDCYFWNSSAKQYFTKCELQVKDGDEWVTVLDILEELGDSLDINTFTVYDLEGSLFRFYAEGGKVVKMMPEFWWTILRFSRN